MPPGPCRSHGPRPATAPAPPPSPEPTRPAWTGMGLRAAPSCAAAAAAAAGAEQRRRPRLCPPPPLALLLLLLLSLGLLHAGTMCAGFVPLQPPDCQGAHLGRKAAWRDGRGLGAPGAHLSREPPPTFCMRVRALLPAGRPRRLRLGRRINLVSSSRLSKTGAGERALRQPPGQMFRMLYCSLPWCLLKVRLGSGFRRRLQAKTRSLVLPPWSWGWRRGQRIAPDGKIFTSF